ncbi:MAG: hypothetical protein RJA98_3297 [Pseudomonadota bacterium]|jgi:hypothetical protein
MSAAVERIVVQATPQDKKAIADKAKRLDLPVSELMRRGAFAYQADDEGDALDALADAAKQAADNAGSAIDEALDYILASNARIAAMEAAAAQPAKAAAVKAPAKTPAKRAASSTAALQRKAA